MNRHNFLARHWLVYSLCLFSTFAGVLGSGKLHAEDAGEAMYEELKPYFRDRDLEPEMMEQPLDWLINQRNNWSSRIGTIGRKVDGFFGGREAADRSNDSFLRIGLFSIFEAGEAPELDPDFKFRLDLPSTKERFKLVLESQTDEFLELENRRNRQARQSRERESSSGFLRFISAPEHWQFNTDIGIRFRVPLDPFVRFEVEREWPLKREWFFRFEQAYYYFHSKGWGHRTQFFFERDLSEVVFLRFLTQARFEQDDDTWDFSQSATLFHQLDFRSATRYQVGWVGENQPQPRTTEYFISTTYRKSVYSDWLFLEVTPALTFSRAEVKEYLVPIRTDTGQGSLVTSPENYRVITVSEDTDFKPTPSLTIGFEMLFSE